MKRALYMPVGNGHQDAKNVVNLYSGIMKMSHP